METETNTESGFGDETEKPRAHGIPVVREGDVELLEFEFRGEIHSVEIRKPTWGRASEVQKGVRIHEYEVPLEDGETRVVKEYDAQDLARAGGRIFDAYVVSINGSPWTRSHSVESLDPEWMTTFLQVLQPRIGTAVDRARKKSTGP